MNLLNAICHELRFAVSIAVAPSAFLPLEDELASRVAGVSVARHAARERLRAIGIACKRLLLRSNKIFNQTS